MNQSLNHGYLSIQEHEDREEQINREFLSNTTSNNNNGNNGNGNNNSNKKSRKNSDRRKQSIKDIIE